MKLLIAMQSAVAVTALLGSLSFSSIVSAGSGHGHGHDDHAAELVEEAKGPNGGKLLVEGDFSVELTIYESGIPPEMRLYAYDHGQPIDPSLWQVEVTLDRLGGEQDTLQFSREGNYLLGNQVIREPHSYDVSVKASFEGKEHHWHYESHEGRSTISERQQQLAALVVERIEPVEMTFTDTLFGVIEIPDDNRFRINAPYPGLVKQVHVQVGDRVAKGQRLLTLTNTDTLQTYSINSPTAGEVSERFVNQGDRADVGTLLEVVDLSTVWVEMSAFPESIEKVAKGQPVKVRDLHQHEVAEGVITYVAPKMTGGHIARTRAVIDNADGHWRPGMHVKSEVLVERRQVPLAVRKTAIQSFREMPVVFAKYGNTFEVRMVELGSTDGEWIEVLGGIRPGTEYVTENSFLLKADVLKDGASHDH